MYIDPFWAGVFATIGSELLLIVTAFIVSLAQYMGGNDE